MARRPEIGNLQLYPDRPLRKSDRNGYVLKFYCPIQGKRIRRNCGTRDRREARKVLRECRERLLNGKYVESDGAITAAVEVAVAEQKQSSSTERKEVETHSWNSCYEMYLKHQKKRRRNRSVEDTTSRLGLAEKIFEDYLEERNVRNGLTMDAVATIDAFEFLQSSLLDGHYGRYETRSPHTVNTCLQAVLAFFRFCKKRELVSRIPHVEKLDTDDGMKGRPITAEEFQRMLDATAKVVGAHAAQSWKFALKVLWTSAFRIGDLMSFSWNDTRQIHPVWGSPHPTIAIPSLQKNGKVQEIPMLPELAEELARVSEDARHGWVANPEPVEFETSGSEVSFRPCDSDLRKLVRQYRLSAVAKLCDVSVAAVKKWLKMPYPNQSENLESVIPDDVAVAVRKLAIRKAGQTLNKQSERLSPERVGRVISKIGKEAGIVVEVADERRQKRMKCASAHDIRRGVAQRLIDAGVSAETLKVLMRHDSFATTERYYGAKRSAQAAAKELAAKLTSTDGNSELVGGGGHEKAPQLSAEELDVLKALLAKL